MQKKQLLMLLYINICLLCSCANKFESETKTIETDIPKEEQSIEEINFTKEEFLADYDYMWEVLEENYLFFGTIEDYGIDVEFLKQDTKQQIEQHVTDLNSFVVMLNSLFQQMQFFAHLGLLETDAYDVMYEYYCNTMVEEESMRAWRISLENPQTQIVYDYMKEKEFTDYVVKNESFPQASYDAVRKTVIFQIPTFTHIYVERDKTFFVDYLKSLDGMEIEHIIFDITGNRGGSDYYWEENIVAPFGGNYEWIYYLYLKDTPLIRDYFFNGQTKVMPLSDLPEDHIPPPFINELGLTHFIRIQWQLSNNPVFKQEILSAKRWVLVDERVYSAADTFCAFCKATGWATLVGRRTLGDGIGYEPILETLPNTGLIIRFSGVVGESNEGFLNTAVGTAPDYYTDAKKLEDPVTACKRLIDKEINGDIDD
ncbi:MAG: S41 family peptidase [Ruminococcus sp.]|nr:S41 family peptidase [Ruminococcus sp.]